MTWPWVVLILGSMTWIAALGYISVLRLRVEAHLRAIEQQQEIQRRGPRSVD